MTRRALTISILTALAVSSLLVANIQTLRSLAIIFVRAARGDEVGI